MKRTPLVCQFKISLHGSVVPVWRRIQVPAKYSFWDLHVAIQDSMGWLDYHLHRFEFRQGKKRIEIGIPDEEYNEPILAGWEIGILEYFVVPGVSALYEYDFGDSWMHEVLLEAISLPTEGKTYPRCIEGEGACPPEDCGGVGGHAELVKVLKGPRNEEYRSMRRWLKGHAKNYWPFEPARFDPDQVRFTDPRKRFRIAFEDPGK
jgi:hypothetical protein